MNMPAGYFSGVKATVRAQPLAACSLGRNQGKSPNQENHSRPAGSNETAAPEGWV